MNRVLVAIMTNSCIFIGFYEIDEIDEKLTPYKALKGLVRPFLSKARKNCCCSRWALLGLSNASGMSQRDDQPREWP